MAPAAEVNAWLGRVRHDLVKRLVWPARDRRDLGGDPEPGELSPRLIDEEGRPASPDAVWKTLAADAPPEATADVLQTFASALDQARAAAAAGDIGGVIALETAFDQMEKALERRSQGRR